jgi:hypothetical protein
MADPNPLVAQINQKLQQLNQRAEQIQGYSQRQQELIVSQPVQDAVNGIRQRIRALGDAIRRMAEARRQLEEIFRQIDPQLDQVLQRLGEDALQDLNLQPLLDLINGINTELNSLEEVVAAAGRDEGAGPGAGAGPRPPRGPGGDGGGGGIAPLPNVPQQDPTAQPLSPEEQARLFWPGSAPNEQRPAQPIEGGAKKRRGGYQIPAKKRRTPNRGSTGRASTRRRSGSPSKRSTRRRTPGRSSK